MTARIIDGKSIAKELRESLAPRVAALKEQGILINDADHGIYRLVTHWGIEAADLPRIAAAIERCSKEM